jgi:hypothetical protein
MLPCESQPSAAVVCFKGGSCSDSCPLSSLPSKPHRWEMASGGANMRIYG